MNETCKHYNATSTKQCSYYHKTKESKVGLCLMTRKNTFLCHFSEKHLGLFSGDSEVITPEQLASWK